MAVTTYPVTGDITGTIDQPAPGTPVSGPITGTIEVDLVTDLGISVGSTTPPATPSPGEVWTTIDGKLYVWNGTVWIQH